MNFLAETITAKIDTTRINRINPPNFGTEGFSSFLIMNPENKSGVVILTNRLNPRPVHRLGIKLLKEMSS